ncbi:MAG TPA: hypothetical protein VG714_00105 [Acidobacteriaceae bacterium]|nr:hypothetical protein [Acidobacteriaceae bacterium]
MLHLSLAFEMNPATGSRWPDRFSERFHIFALGENFDVDLFLANSDLSPSFVWHQIGNGPTNGIELLLGDSETATLSEQEKIAIEYLKLHREELRRLAQFPGVEKVNLGLVYRLPVHGTGCCLGPSHALMFHALDSGVSPNYYVTLVDRGINQGRPQSSAE